MNRVEITGKIYNIKESTTTTGKSVTRFGLSIYNGKDKNGKSQYGFVDCKYFGRITPSELLKDIVGRLTIDSWEKDGKKFSKVEILVEEIKESDLFTKVAQPQKQPEEEFKDDDIDEVFE